MLLTASRFANIGLVCLGLATGLLDFRNNGFGLIP